MTAHDFPHGKAEGIARKVARRCRAEIAKAEFPPDGWLMATLAEALTHQGATEEAAGYYRQVADIFRGRWLWLFLGRVKTAKLFDDAPLYRLDRKRFAG